MRAQDPEISDVTDEAVASFAQTPDARLRDCLVTLTRHLHAAAVELQLTIPEWEYAVDFLTRTGQMCDEVRQEFVLLSDVLGVSSLVETLNHAGADAATEATVLGPFHMVASPARQWGDSLDELNKPGRCLVTGRVVDAAGVPVGGATVDVWQADENGFYDVQVPDLQPRGNGRGLFHADEEGRFCFTTVVPSHYPIPTDGPVGDLLRATSRHAFRPAHIHFIVAADGFEQLTTHIFVAGSPYLDSDAVFAVKRSLIRELTWHDDAETASRFGLPSRYGRFDVELVVAHQASDA